MHIGVPKEIKDHEYRVGLVPASVREVVRAGHTVSVQAGAGANIGFEDAEYVQAGAKILDTAKEVFATCEMIVKVKEPQAAEFKLLRENQLLFTYLHLAADHAQLEALKKSKCIAFAYETVTNDKGHLPLLAPMSEVAGRVSVQVGAFYLQKANGGSGVLLGAVPGVARGQVFVIGGGVSGFNAARMAMGLGARVVIADRSIDRLNELDAHFGTRVTTVYSTTAAIEEYVAQSDLVIGAVLVPGASAPKIVTREMIKRMKKGSVVVDIAIDQGGCFETSRPTSHTHPTYIEEGVVHYCVTNMPSATARTAALALNNATLPYVLALAAKGHHAVLESKHIHNGLNVYKGHLVHPAVAKSFNEEAVRFEDIF